MGDRLVVKGHDILYNCPVCYASGFSVKLRADGDGRLVCENDESHVFMIENGFLKRVRDDGR